MPDTPLERCLAEYSKRYPPLIIFQQAAEIAQRPVGTVYDWSSRGRFDGFKLRCGRECRLLRDQFVTFLFGLDGEAAG